MKKMISRTALFTGILALCLFGTAMMSYADTSETEAAGEERGERPEDDGSVSAKIVSLSGSTLTVYLEERQEPPADGAAPEDGTAPAEGETPPEKPEGETTDGTEPPALPEGDGTSSDGTTPPEGGMGHGGMGGSFSEETTALTVTSSTTVTEGMEQTSASLSDLEADDIVRLTLDEDGTTVVSISIMGAMEPPAEAAESES